MRLEVEIVHITRLRQPDQVLLKLFREPQTCAVIIVGDDPIHCMARPRDDYVGMDHGSAVPTIYGSEVGAGAAIRRIRRSAMAGCQNMRLAWVRVDAQKSQWQRLLRAMKLARKAVNRAVYQKDASG
jgi:hypothetical protein